MRLRSITPRSRLRPSGRFRRRARRHRRAGRAKACGRAGGAHSRREGILGPDAFAVRGDAGAAAGNRDRGGIGSRRARRTPQRAAPHRRSRHRHRRHSAGAAAANCESHRRRHRSRPDAIETAQANAPALGLSARAQFVRTDFGSGLDRPFDLVVSNPPYIATGEIAAACNGSARPRSEARARWRQRRARCLSGACRRRCHRSCRARHGVCWKSGSARRRRSRPFSNQAGLCLTATKADLAGIPRALAFQRGDNTHP